MLQLRAEHRWNAVKSRAPFLGDGLEGFESVEMWSRNHSCGGVQDCYHVTHYHSKAMVERHWNANAITRRDPHTFGDEQGVVDNVVMTEDRSLRAARGSRSVLNVDRLIEGDSRLSLPQFGEGDAIAHCENLFPA